MDKKQVIFNLLADVVISDWEMEDIRLLFRGYCNTEGIDPFQFWSVVCEVVKDGLNHLPPSDAFPSSDAIFKEIHKDKGRFVGWCWKYMGDDARFNLK